MIQKKNVWVKPYVEYVFYIEYVAQAKSLLTKFNNINIIKQQYKIFASPFSLEKVSIEKRGKCNMCFHYLRAEPDKSSREEKFYVGTGKKITMMKPHFSQLL